MAESIDQLQIDIEAQAVKANDAIDKFIGELDRLSTSIEKIDGSKLIGLSNGVSRLGSAMQNISNVKTSQFTSLTKNIEKFGNLDVAALNSAASSMSHITRSFSGFGAVSANAQAVGDMAKNISKLGNKSVQSAIANMPRLATSMNQLITTLSKSPQISNNLIQMTNALATFTNQGSKISSSANAITSGLNKTVSAVANTSKRTFSLSSAIGKFYQSAFYITRAIKGLYSSVESTSDYIEGFNYYTVAFEKIASEWDKNFENYGSENAQKYSNAFVEKMNAEMGKLSGLKLNLSADMEGGTLTTSGEKNLALNLQEVTQYASQIASITNSVGQNGTISTTASSVFTKLAGDMSSLFNADYSSVANNLQSGLIGQSRALYKYGIDITNATLQTYAYKYGVEKAVSEMTQAEKMQLRMIAILDQSKVAWGDLADTINTPANMLRQWTNNCKEAAMTLGQLFMPLVEYALPILNGFTIAIKTFLTNVAALMGIEIDLSSIGSGTNDVSEELEDIASGYDDATDAAKKYQNQILGFDEITKLQDTDTGTSSTSSSGSSIDLTNEILDSAAEYENVWNEAYSNLESKAEDFAKLFAAPFASIEEIVEDFAIGDYFEVGEDVSDLVAGITDFVSEAIAEVDWKQIGEDIGDFLAGIKWSKVIKSGLKLTFNIGEAIADVWFESFNTAPIETAILSALAIAPFTGIGGKLAKAMAKTLGIEGVSLAVPLAIAGFTLAFGYEVGKEKEELQENMEKYGEEKGREMSGNGVVDRTALSQYDTENANNDVNQVYADGILDFLEDVSEWGKDISKNFKKVGKAIKDAFSAETWESVGEQIATWWDDDVLGTMDEDFADWIEDTKENFSHAGEVLKYMFSEEAWEEVGGQIKTWFESGIQSVTDYFSESIEACGGDIVAGMLKGILDALLGIGTWIKDNIFTPFIEGFKDVFGIHSPSTVMKKQGGFIIEGLLQGLKDKVQKIYDWFIDLPDKVKEAVGDLAVKISLKIENIKTKLKEKWDSAKEWWDENKPDLSKVSTKVESVKDKIKEKWNSAKEWWDENKPSLKKISTKTNDIKASLKEKWNSAKEWWDENKPNLKKFSVSIPNIKEMLEDAFKEAVEWAKDNFKFQFKVSYKTTGLGTVKQAIVNVLGLKGWPTFKFYKYGGFPDRGQMFVANEAGPEMVGTMDGKTAVANNNQITDGIANAVYPAVYNAMMAALSQGGNDNGDIVVQIGEKEVFRAVRRQANNYTRQTGQPAFSY